jgi:serine/threonine protein phosphatase PrpC
MTFAWAAATDQGLVRGHNEDALWPRPAGGEVARGEATDPFLAAVADGMGGHVGGEVASRLAIEAAVATDGDPVARVLAANAAVLGTARDRPRLTGMGTTLTLAIFSGDTVEIGHIGDSRAYRYREGVLDQLTRDHSLVAEMVASGELRPEEAAAHPFRSVITRALGLESAVAVDLVQRDALPGDRFLLCSDGLTTMLDPPRIAALLAGGDGPAVATALVEAANQAGGLDNTSVVVVDVRS